jgi:hypothetical protein
MQHNPGQVRELDQHAELRPFSELNLKRVYLSNQYVQCLVAAADAISCWKRRIFFPFFTL